MTEKTTQPQYDKPRVILIDLPETTENGLIDLGYNVAKGTFGTVQKVERSDTLSQVPVHTHSLPDIEEQEIIIIDLSNPTVSDQVEMEECGSGVECFWQSKSSGRIDPRPLVMRLRQNVFERILNHGGVFIIFLAPQRQIEYVYGCLNFFEEVQRIRTLKCSSIGLLKYFEDWNWEDSNGTEISINPNLKRFSNFLMRNFNGGSFSTKVSTGYLNERTCWTDLVFNKYGDTVGGHLQVSKKRDGHIFLLPSPTDHNSFLCELFTDWLPSFTPHLFPHFEGAKWIHRSEYELLEVLKINSEIEKVECEAEKRVQELNERKTELKLKGKMWYTLLNGTGDDLVQAVIECLEIIGFKEVIDVDAKAKADPQETRNLREDIQIHDGSPVLIVDVKGITGTPEDAESTQSEKHALMRAKEFEGNIKPLTIINHQRNIPPLDRNPNPYREEIIGNAHQTQLGLMTTWDLFRLARNMERLNWDIEVVKPIFYRSGLIEPVPEHYQEIGTVVHVWEHSFGIVPDSAIHVGDTAVFYDGIKFHEFKVTSLQVNSKSVNIGNKGDNVGIAFQDESYSVKKHLRVFVVREESVE